MQETYTENIRKVLQNKKKIEKELQIKLSNKGKNLFLDGKPEDEFIALQAIEAINLGFTIEKVLLLKNENIILQTVNIKDITKRHDLERVRARIIGTRGKTLKTLSTLTNCEFTLSDNQVGIIGNAENIDEAIQAVTYLIHGSKQSNVYSRTEKEMKKKRLNTNL